MHEIETRRLRLRRLTVDDAPFMLALLNDPDFLRFVGDKGVRTLDDARAHIVSGPLESYAQHGFGVLLVQAKDSGAALGICGLLRRPILEDADLGFAFLPAARGCGYASEAAAAVLREGRERHGLQRIVAIVDEPNLGSARVLEKVGLHFDRLIHLAGEPHPVRLYTT